MSPLTSVILVSQQFLYALQCPASGCPGMFMNKVPALAYLVVINLAAELNVLDCLLFRLFEFRHPYWVMPVLSNIQLL